MNAIDHILVVCEDSRAGRRALRSAAAVADEHRARADRLGCDLVLVPVRGFFAGWSVRRLRCGMRADVRGVRSA